MQKSSKLFLNYRKTSENTSKLSTNPKDPTKNAPSAMSFTSLTDATMPVGGYVPSSRDRTSCVSTRLSLVELRPSSDPRPPPEIG